MAMAAALQFVEPVDDPHIRLGPVSRTLWREPPLAERHPELLAWRDRLYARHRAGLGAA
jgi:glutathione S-transferase